MTRRISKRIEGRLTDTQKQRHRAIREQVEKDRPGLTREALAKKSELVALRDAMMMLKREREARGLSLGDVSERSGIDRSRLSKLETDPRANPTISTLTRVAEAIGVTLTIQVAA